jgi:hypothetical protein
MRYDPTARMMGKMEWIRAMIVRCPLILLGLPMVLIFAAMLSIHIYLLENTGSDSSGESNKKNTSDPEK